MYRPHIRSARLRHTLPLPGGYTLRLFDEVESAQTIRFAFLAECYPPGTEEPVRIYSSEENFMAEEGKGSHFFCTFTESSHLNHGASDRWANFNTFPRSPPACA